MAAPLRMRPSQKILALGDYETGKTTLAKRILSSMPRILAFDPRQDVLDKGHRDLAHVEGDFVKTGRGIYAPGRGDLQRKLDEFCELALRHHNALVFVDEPSMVGQLPQSFHDLHRLGHARGLGVLVATHTIWDLPHVAHQAHHLFVFRVTRPVELNTLRQVISEKGVDWLPTAPPFHSWYKGSGIEGPINWTRKEVKRDDDQAVRAVPPTPPTGPQASEAVGPSDAAVPGVPSPQ